MTTLNYVWIRDVRANYNQRKIVVVIELSLTAEAVAALLPVVNAAQTETPVKLTVERIQQTLPGMGEVKSLT